jgi:hypothetical protein
VRLLANTGEDTIFAFGLPNSVETTADEHGWTTIPFGMWLHNEGYQRFGMKEAESIVDAFKSACGRLKRAIASGTPIYKGHPDIKSLANKYPDKTEYGQVSDMEVSDRGLRIRQVLSNAGTAIVQKLGLDRISPVWSVASTGETLHGRPIFAPVAIQSIGLTDKPNIPNLSLYNSKEDETMNKEALIKLLALANEATDEQIVSAIVELQKRPEVKVLDNAKDELAVEKAKVLTLTAERDAEKRRADEGAKALANEKAVVTKGLIEEAIKTGKIAAADKPTWERILANDLEAGRKILANVKPALKTKERATTEDLNEADRRARQAFANDGGDDPGADGNEMANVGARIQKLVQNEKKMMGDCGLKGNALHNRAYANVKKNFPKLFQPVAHGAAEA